MKALTFGPVQERLQARLESLDRTLYPFEHHFLDLNGLRYHYLDEGGGSPLVMLHGNPTWSFYFRDLVKTLSGSNRCIVPDHMGCGFSDKPGDGQYAYTLKQRVDDLDTLLKELNVTENITLVLHDWGGMIGMAYASRYPERIKRLIILNTSAFQLPKAKGFPWQLWLTRTPLGAVLVRGFNMFSWASAKTSCKRAKLSKVLSCAYRAPYDTWANRIATLRFVQDIPLKATDPGFDIVQEVQSGLERFSKVPMLICWGEQDFVFDRHFLAEWEKAFPKAEVHRFQDCGHYVLEDAGEEIAQLVQAFLRKHEIVSTNSNSDSKILT